jgi:hypothetical protein
MQLEEHDKAVVRNFLTTSSAEHWLEYAKNSCPTLKLGEVDAKSYNISLYEARGWDNAIKFLKGSVEEPHIPDYGVHPIDTVSD